MHINPVVLIACLLSLPVFGWAQVLNETKFLASDGGPNDNYGNAVALDGDRIVIGAYGSASAQESGYDFGSVYVYEWDGGVWDETKLTAFDRQRNDNFGKSVAIDGDRIVVGAPYDDDNADNSGSVYVFDYDGRFWETTKLTASDPELGDWFGHSVAISGDRIVVGAYRADDQGINSGCAYIYDWNGATWVESKLTASDGEPFEEFGYSVSVDADRIAVGARFENTNGYKSGAAYIYDWDGSQWIETKLTADDGDIYDEFGISIDLDSARLVVGADKDDDGASLSGSVYIYDWSGSVWNESKLTAFDGAFSDHFGYSLALDGDNLIVGAVGDDGLVGNGGSAYLYKHDSSGWVVNKLMPSDATSGDRFGYAVAIQGNRTLVGAWLDDENGYLSGSAYLYEGISNLIIGNNQPAGSVASADHNESTDNFTLTTKESLKGSLNVFPNPTAGTLTFSAEQPIIGEILISSMLGHEVLCQEANNVKRIDLDVSHLPAGVYLVQTEELTTRFVKE